MLEVIIIIVAILLGLLAAVFMIGEFIGRSKFENNKIRLAQCINSSKYNIPVIKRSLTGDSRFYFCIFLAGYFGALEQKRWNTGGFPSNPSHRIILADTNDRRLRFYMWMAMKFLSEYFDWSTLEIQATGNYLIKCLGIKDKELLLHFYSRILPNNPPIVIKDKELLLHFYAGIDLALMHESALIDKEVEYLLS